MGKMQQIRTMLEQGKTHREIEAAGYILSTVRKVATQYEQDRLKAEVRALRENDPEQLDSNDDDPEEFAQAAQEEIEMSAAEVQEITAKLQQLTDKVETLGTPHDPGLCAAETCAPCQTSKREWGGKVAEEVRTRVIGELTAACEWAGTTELLDAVSEIHDQWTAQGKPTEPRKVEPAPLMVGGVEITP